MQQAGEDGQADTRDLVRLVAVAPIAGEGSIFIAGLIAEVEVS